MFFYRTTLLDIKLVFNLVYSTAILLCNFKTNRFWKAFSWFALVLVLPSVRLYVLLKKMNYNKKYLRRMYIPSNKLFIFTSILETVVGLFLYILTKRYLFGIIHFILIILILLYVLAGSSSRRQRISSFNKNFQLGIMSKDLMGSSGEGLRNGEVVKIMKKTTNGYRVKNSDGNEYEINDSDISEIMEML